MRHLSQPRNISAKQLIMSSISGMSSTNGIMFSTTPLELRIRFECPWSLITPFLFLRRLPCVRAIEKPQTLNVYDTWSYDSRVNWTWECARVERLYFAHQKNQLCVCIWWTAKIYFSFWIRIAISRHEQSIVWSIGGHDFNLCVLLCSNSPLSRYLLNSYDSELNCNAISLKCRTRANKNSNAIFGRIETRTKT